jgi:hypothetical protein
MSTEQVAAIFAEARRKHLASGDLEAAARVELLAAYVTSPEARRAIESAVFALNSD